MITSNSFAAEAHFNGRPYTPTHYFMYEGKYIGSFIINEDSDGVGIWNLCIKEEYRGQGYGKLMMLEILMRFGHKPLYLFVYKDNEVALNLYESVGFKIFCEHEVYPAWGMGWRREDV